ncbi:MAG: hypothetical protein ACFFDT_04220 [Candidatus Hodarchaeota archaeon]
MAEYFENYGNKLFFSEVEREEVDRSEDLKFRFWRILSLLLVTLIIASLMFHAYQFRNIQSLTDENRLLNTELENYSLKRPSIAELREFLTEDSTDKRYPSERYDCKNFATDLRFNARNQGYNMCIVMIDINYHFTGPNGTWTYYGGHTINGVILDDKTFVYVEPQMDYIIEKDLEKLKSHILSMFFEDRLFIKYYGIEIQEVELIDEVQVW